MTLPVPPSANRYWRMARNRIYIAAEGKKFRKDVQQIALEAGIKMMPKSAEIAVVAHWYRARKSGDLDNRMKQLWDALQGVAYEDDKQIVEIHAYRHDDRRQPRMEVSLVASSARRA